MKKVKLTFWLIGFGCGMIVTGIIGAISTLNVSTDKLKAVVSQDEVVAWENNELAEDTTQDTAKKMQDKIRVKENQLEEVTKEINENHNRENMQTTIENDTEFTGVEKVSEVIIPSQVTASEICKILQQNGIVQNSDDFLAYIKEQKKQTMLKSGKYILPIEGSYEEILKQLLS